VNHNLLNTVKQIVSEKGESVLADPQKLKPLFSDYAKDEPKSERVAFGRCVEMGAYWELKNASGANERQRRKTALADQMHTATGIDRAQCAAALDLLEAALFGASAISPVSSPGFSPPPASGSGGYNTPKIHSPQKSFCNGCGTQLTTGSQFCNSCGAKAGTPHNIVVNVTTQTGQTPGNPQTADYPPGYMPKSWLAALLLCLLLGVHRLYVGKIGTGLILLTLYITGFFTSFITWIPYYIWWVIDLVSICTNKFTDARGFKLKKS